MNDDDLIRAYLTGDESAFTTLHQRHCAAIYRFVRSLVRNDDTAHDVTRQTFANAIRGLATYQIGRNFRSWLYAIAHNLVRDLLPRSRREVPLSQRGEDATDGPDRHCSRWKRTWAHRTHRSAQSREAFAFR